MGGSHVSAHCWLDGSAKTVDQGLHVHLDFGEHHSQQPGQHWPTLANHFSIFLKIWSSDSSARLHWQKRCLVSQQQATNVCHGPEVLWEHANYKTYSTSINCVGHKCAFRGWQKDWNCIGHYHWTLPLDITIKVVQLLCIKPVLEKVDKGSS